MFPDELQRMKNASTKAYFDMLVSELSNRIEIPLGFDFSELQSLRKCSTHKSRFLLRLLASSSNIVFSSFRFDFWCQSHVRGHLSDEPVDRSYLQP